MKAAEYGETPAAAHFGGDKKLKRALGDAAKTVEKKKASGTFQSLGLSCDSAKRR